MNASPSKKLFEQIEWFAKICAPKVRSSQLISIHKLHEKYNIFLAKHRQKWNRVFTGFSDPYERAWHETINLISLLFLCTHFSQNINKLNEKKLTLNRIPYWFDPIVWETHLSIIGTSKCISKNLKCIDQQPYAHCYFRIY